MTTMVSRPKRSAGRPPSSELEAHKNSILEAATDVFMEFGFAKASTAAIARRAGASKATLYSLFPSKEELYVALLQRRVANVVLPIAAASMSLDAPIEETLENFGRRMVIWVTSDEASRLYKLIVAEATRFPTLGAALWQNGPETGRKALREYLDRLVKLGRLNIPDTDVAALQFQGMLVGMAQVRQNLSQPSLIKTNAKLKAWVQQGVAAFVRGYRPYP